ncbi:hypothetical protein CRG98_013440 [Punica granatum]|uniref:Uncharacterized protein n=1 Tax=Punica granatum TaxID=22663 RepID=A0A2I0KCC9_PUNGR|nr:hypothetical protein CRG98_013440 [Punica granatum]
MDVRMLERAITDVGGCQVHGWARGTSRRVVQERARVRQVGTQARGCEGTRACDWWAATGVLFTQEHVLRSKR